MNRFLTTFITKVKSKARFKKIAHYLLVPPNDYKPRLWIRICVNPFFHSINRNSIIRHWSRLDVFPHHNFSIGSRSIIEDFSTINNGVGNVIIGENTVVGLGNVIIGPVSIGDNVMLAQNIVISGLNHGYEDTTTSPALQDVTCKEIVISDDVWIGANTVVTAGVTIGKHSIVGAGSVVTKDVPPFTVAVGNPARIIKRYNSELSKWERC